jgi:hypothetical protein
MLPLIMAACGAAVAVIGVLTTQAANEKDSSLSKAEELTQSSKRKLSLNIYDELDYEPNEPDEYENMEYWHGDTSDDYSDDGYGWR